MARKRSLRPEEQELWQAVTRSIQPMHGAYCPDQPPAAAPIGAKAVPSAARVEPAAAPQLKAFRLGEKAAPQPGVKASSPAAPQLRMDAKTHSKMTKGKMAPEARIDLHGLTLSEAHPELIHFLMRAHSAGFRLVLVITGKGKQVYEPIPRPIGALRHQVPHWLRLPPLSFVVQEVSQAHLRHGGSGAFYVWLRRGLPGKS